MNIPLDPHKSSVKNLSFGGIVVGSSIETKSHDDVHSLDALHSKIIGMPEVNKTIKGGEDAHPPCVAQSDPTGSSCDQHNGSVVASTLPAVARTGNELLAQVAREAEATGQTQEVVHQLLSECRDILIEIGYPPGQPVDEVLINSLNRFANQDHFTSAKARACNALARGYTALLHTNFPVLLRAALKSAEVSYKTLSKSCGASIGKIMFWLADPLGGVTGMTVEQAKAIDITVGANGTILAAYLALTQDAAYESTKSIIEQLSGKISFGARLLESRQKTKRPLREILAELESKKGVKLTSSQLNQWETGLYIPSQASRNVVEAFDSVYCADGALIKLWESETPRANGENYSLAITDFPPRLGDQFKKLLDYQVDKSQGTSRKRNQKSWSAPTAAMFAEFCENFFGFLKNNEKIAESDLSLTLLCDWSLVKKYYVWMANRRTVVEYRTYEHWRTAILMGLYNSYFPQLEMDAAQDNYWRGRVQDFARIDISVTSDFSRQKREPLNNWSEQWRHHVALARRKAGEFQKGNKFTADPYIGRVQAFLQSGLRVRDIARVLSIRIRSLPPRILSRKAAVACRRLAESALLISWYLQPCTFLRLQSAQLTIDPTLRVSLDIPENQFRNRGMAGAKGGISGELLDWPELHEVFRRYVQEARPILLGGFQGHHIQDAGYLFIDAHAKPRKTGQASAEAGRPIGVKAFDHDILLAIGCNARAVFFLAAADLLRDSNNINRVAELLHTTPANVSRTFGPALGLEKTERSNKTMKNVFFRNGEVDHDTQ